MKLIGTSERPLEWLPRLTPEIDLTKFVCMTLATLNALWPYMGRIFATTRSEKKWFRWDEQRWIVDSKQQVRIMTKRVMVKFLTQATQRGDDAMENFAKNSLNAKRLEYALSLAQPELVLLSSDLDRDPWLLNFRNGTLDLRDSVFVLTIARTTSPNWCRTISNLMLYVRTG